MNNWKALKCTDNMQGGSRKSNFHRSLVSSVCLLPGSLGCGEDQVISLVGKCFQELRTRGHAGWQLTVPESLAFWGRAGSWLPSQPTITILLLAPLSSLRPGSLAQCYRLLPYIYFPCHKSHLYASGSGKFCLGLFSEQCCLSYCSMFHRDVFPEHQKLIWTLNPQSS